MKITDPAPADVSEEIRSLRAALDQVIPAKGPNLLIGTWNVRDFDKVTQKWRSQAGDSPIRDLSNVLCIAEIVRRFDVCAIQEVRESAQGLLLMLQTLGPDWAFLVTDVTQGKAGNNERLSSCSTRAGSIRLALPASWWWRRNKPASRLMCFRGNSPGRLMA
jgi:hypothetical protein